MTRIALRKLPRNPRWSRHAAAISIPVGGYMNGVGDIEPGAVITVGSVGWSFRGALKKATSVAKRIAKDPAFMSMMPPQVTASIATAKRLAAAAKKGRKTLTAAYKSLPAGVRKKMKGIANKMLKQSKPEARADMSYAEPLPDEVIPGADNGMAPEAQPEAYADEMQPEVYADEMQPEAYDDGGADEYADAGEGEQY